MTHDWFIIHNGKESGPYGPQQLKQMAATGKLQPDDKVRRADMKAARKASSIKGLFPTGEPAPTKSSPPVTATAPPPATQKKGVPSKKTIIIASVVSGACLFLCCGGFIIIGLKMTDTARKDLAEADGLWSKGDKVGAVSKYRDLLGTRSGFLKEDDRARVYGRVIDSDAENGNTDSAKKLIAEAIERKVKPAVSHPEAVKLVTAEEARARGEVLTAEFYPYKKGAVQRSMATVYIGEGQMQSSREYTHEGDGMIVERFLEHFIMPGHKQLPLGNPKKHFYREKDGFIEIGEQGEFIKETTWSPVIKLGALAGDEWERETTPGVITERYKVVKFNPEAVSFKGGSKETIMVAFIEMRMTASLDGGKKMEMGQDIQLGRGIGLVQRRAWRIEQGQRKDNWTENFIPSKEAEAGKRETEKVEASDSPTTFKVSKGAFSGSLELRVLVSDEITVSDPTLDSGTLNFKLHWKKSIGRPRDPWHYSAYDKDGVKIDGGAVGIPDSMELGQKVKARIVLRSENVKEITRIDIHQ